MNSNSHAHTLEANTKVPKGREVCVNVAEVVSRGPLHPMTCSAESTKGPANFTAVEAVGYALLVGKLDNGCAWAPRGRCYSARQSPRGADQLEARAFGVRPLDCTRARQRGLGLDDVHARYRDVGESNQGVVYATR
jgi:hypothetical protein